MNYLQPKNRRDMVLLGSRNTYLVNNLTGTRKIFPVSAKPDLTSGSDRRIEPDIDRTIRGYDSGILGQYAFYISQDRMHLNRIDVKDGTFTSTRVVHDPTKKECYIRALAVDPSQQLIHTVDSAGMLRAYAVSGSNSVFCKQINNEQQTGSYSFSCMVVEGNLVAMTSHKQDGLAALSTNREDMLGFLIHVLSSGYTHQVSGRIAIDQHPTSTAAAIANQVPNPVVSLAFSRAYASNFLLATTRFHSIYLLQITNNQILKISSHAVSDGNLIS